MCLKIVRWDEDLTIHAVGEAEKATIDIEEMAALNNAKRMMKKARKQRGFA